MKRQGTLLAAMFFLFCALGLIRLTQTNAADFGAFGQTLLSQGAIPMEAEIMEAETSEAEPAPSPVPSPSESPQSVPVEIVEEAWDEELRKTQPEPEPREISINETDTLELRNETDYEIDFSELPSLPALPDVGRRPPS